MSWFKYIFHKHRWYYFGHFTNQYIFKCEVCHREKKINIVTEGHYHPKKIDKIREQMNNSTSHLGR